MSLKASNLLLVCIQVMPTGMIFMTNDIGNGDKHFDDETQLSKGKQLSETIILKQTIITNNYPKANNYPRANNYHRTKLHVMPRVPRIVNRTAEACMSSN